MVCSPQSIHRTHVGESERLLRDAFSEAYALASTGKPSVIFIDEIDAICPPRDSRYMNVKLTSHSTQIIITYLLTTSNPPDLVDLFSDSLMADWSLYNLDDFFYYHICFPFNSFLFVGYLPRKQHESRIVGQLLTLMDGSKSLSKSLPHISVIASTNR